MPASLQQIDAGLYRWTAPHPEWDPVADQLDSSYQEVVSHLIVGSEAAAFVDPLAPPEPAEPFWRKLDDLIAPVRGSLAVVLSLHWHERSATEFAARYTAPVYAPAEAASDIETAPWRPTSPSALNQQLLPLLELPISKVLTAHGPPALSGGREALQHALRAGA